MDSKMPTLFQGRQAQILLWLYLFKEAVVKFILFSNKSIKQLSLLIMLK